MAPSTPPPGTRRPRVLLSAYLCRPDRGSESAVGWNRALESARRCDTWVLCQTAWNRAAIEAWLDRNGPVPGLEFAYVPKTRWERWLAGIPGLYWPVHSVWQRRALATATRLHERVGFDLAHQIGYASFREPGYLWRLGIPFVWGPVGGTQRYPWRLLPEAGLRGAAAEAFRNVATLAQLRLGRRIRRAAREADVLLAATSTVQRDLARLAGREPERMLETGLGAVADRPPPGHRSGEPFRVSWAGEVRAFKGLGLLVDALARLPADLDWILEVVGGGPREAALRRRAARRGVADRIAWTGWVDHAEALERIARSHVLAFTSLRDTSGNVVLEALAAGVPVIGLDHQGVHDMLTPESGIRVPVGRRDRIVADLAAAVERLARDEAARRALADGALARARRYGWDRRGERMAEIYERALGRPLPAPRAEARWASTG